MLYKRESGEHQPDANENKWEVREEFSKIGTSLTTKTDNPFSTNREGGLLLNLSKTYNDQEREKRGESGTSNEWK